MTDAFDALRIPDAPDLEFASGLRSRIERALLTRREVPTSVTEATTADVAAPSQPPSQHTITPYLATADARASVDFYVDAFGAAERDEPIVMPDGRIGHVEIVVGDSVLMLADEYPELDLLAPVTRGGPSQSLRIQVADPDAVVQRAVAAGGVLERPVADSPHGRGGVVRDPSGHRWMVSREAPSAAAPRRGDVVHTSLWTDDVERAERFYGAVLGWVTAPGYGPQERQVTNAGARLGLSGGHAGPTAMLCYAVPDVDAAVAVGRAAGGTAGDPTGEPHGRVADCVDDMGVPFALWTGAPAPAPAPEARPAIAHLMMRTPDARRARAFYGTVLGWGFAPARVPDGWNVRAAGGASCGLAPRSGAATPGTPRWCPRSPFPTSPPRCGPSATREAPAPSPSGAGSGRRPSAATTRPAGSSSSSVEPARSGPLDCNVLEVHGDDQVLLVYSAAPGTPAAEALRLLQVIGLQDVGHTSTDYARPPAQGQDITQGGL